MLAAVSANDAPCPYCQTPNSVHARFCRECGRELDPERFAAPTIFDDPEEEQRRRPPRLLVIVLLVLLVVGAVSAIVLTRGGEPKPTATVAPQQQQLPRPPPPAGPNSPAGVIRAHWNAIGGGDYRRAYALFSTQYKQQAAERGWVGQHRRDRPRVHIGDIHRVASLPGQQAFVFADIYSRDTGSIGDHSACIRFAGKVRVIRQGGRWRYWAQGPGQTFQRKTSPSPDDKRCKPLFG
ncbi:MAG: hypothetical protein QOC86_311 [Gaiellales bacterium]|jgi:hypothetical protein|nr:hypothetical protein [Gaiellales bacterium]